MKKGRIFIAAFTISIMMSLVFMAMNLKATEGRGEGVKPEMIPRSLKGLDIKDHYIPSNFRKAGVIHRIRGNVVVTHKATQKSYFGKKGDIVYENDSIHTLYKSRCRIRLFGDDIISMAQNSEFSVESYRDNRKKKRKLSIFSMLRGKVKFYAMRLLRYKRTRFRVKTPTAIVGVRGTKFITHVYYTKKDQLASNDIRVADSSNEVARYLASTDSEEGGGSPNTDLHCQSGDCEVNGESVPGGSSYNGQTGEIDTSDPDVVNQLENETSFDDEEEEGGDAEDPFIPNPDTFDDDKNDQKDIPPLREHKGYFAAMVMNVTDSELQDIFLSKSSKTHPDTGTRYQDFDRSPGASETGALAYGIDNTSDYLEICGNSPIYESPHLWGGIINGSSFTAPANSFNWQESPTSPYGRNLWQEWGPWEMTTKFTAGSSSSEYQIIKGYSIVGVITPDAAVSGFSGVANYSGVAVGTYYGGYDMTGSFSCMVDFDATSNHISQFGYSVSGSGHSASLTGASGSLNSGTFSITNGTATLTSPTGSYTDVTKEAQGSLFGDNAEAIGGVWGMKANSTNGAFGVFQGTDTSRAQ